MSSASLTLWKTVRAATLNEIEAAHTSVGGSGRGRRYATQQINHAYVVLLSGQFQGFCRDLHSECSDYLANAIQPTSLQNTFLAELSRDRKLDKRNVLRQRHLEKLNDWRNAIAHQDFDPLKLGNATVQLAEVRQWRRSCSNLTVAFDGVMELYLSSILGKTPW